jgi:hypothetical protein
MPGANAGDRPDYMTGPHRNDAARICIPATTRYFIKIIFPTRV